MKYNEKLRSHICICHDNWVVTYLDVWPDLVVKMKTKAKRTFTSFELRAHILFVKGHFVWEWPRGIPCLTLVVPVWHEALSCHKKWPLGLMICYSLMWHAMPWCVETTYFWICVSYARNTLITNFERKCSNLDNLPKIFFRKCFFLILN